MEIYEIVRTEILERHGNGWYTGRPSVITATMDKYMAERMLDIYKQNQSENESYEIRTISAREPEHLNGCVNCNSYNRCLTHIDEHPGDMIRCVRFGDLVEYVQNRGNEL